VDLVKKYSKENWNKTECSLVAFYDIWPGNGIKDWGLFFDDMPNSTSLLTISRPNF